MTTRSWWPSACHAYRAFTRVWTPTRHKRPENAVLQERKIFVLWVTLTKPIPGTPQLSDHFLLQIEINISGEDAWVTNSIRL